MLVYKVGGSFFKHANEFFDKLFCEDAGADAVGDAVKGLVDSVKSGKTPVIGRMSDMKTIGANEVVRVADYLPNLGDPKLNWEQNSSVLRQVMSEGKPIRDASLFNAIDSQLGIRCIENASMIRDKMPPLPGYESDTYSIARRYMSDSTEFLKILVEIGNAYTGKEIQNITPNEKMQMDGLVSYKNAIK